MTTHEKRYFSIDFEKYGHQTDHKSLYVDVPLNEVTVKIELLDPIGTQKVKRIACHIYPLGETEGHPLQSLYHYDTKYTEALNADPTMLQEMILEDSP